MNAQPSRWGFVGALLLLSALPASAGPITVPSGLAAGSQYRLVFVTSGFISATSTDIGTYDTFVTNAANSDATLSALNTTWLAIVSTFDVDAVDHIGAVGNVYNTGGQQVSNTTSSLFWSGLHLNTIGTDETGTTVTGSGGQTYVWTGTTIFGAAHSTRYMGATSPQVGQWSSAASAWTAAAQQPASFSYRLYGISGDLTVPGGVPEPATLALMGAGLAVIGVLKARRRSIRTGNR